MAKSSAKPSEYSFESALERLEQIVEEMEGDKLPLEELLGRYEEGTRLVKVCQERLNTAEKRIELISRNAAGSADLSAFEAASVAASAPASEPAPRQSSRKPPEDEVSLF